MIDDDDRETKITSTRSNASVDARRDFDGFAVDEELARLRRALRDGQWRAAAELTANIDEHLSRGGSLPVAWLGPVCMQTATDLDERRQDSLRAAARLTPQERTALTSSYVAIAPAPDLSPRSSWGIGCHEKGCVEELVLERTTAEPSTDEDDCRNLNPAHATAAVFLGWRLFQRVWWCPSHVIAKNLACKRCLSACPACSCVSGPTGDAVPGLDVEAKEI